jgi:hypothetical protein
MRIETTWTAWGNRGHRLDAPDDRSGHRACDGEQRSFLVRLRPSL